MTLKSLQIDSRSRLTPVWNDKINSLMKNIINYPIIDLHVHLRDKVSFYSKQAKYSGLSILACMPNTNPCLDNLETIKQYLLVKNYTKIIPVSAITLGRKGKELVNIDKLKKHVLGFSDDGDCLMNLDLVKEALDKDVLLMVHLEPEVEMTRKYLQVLSKVKSGRLHIQHVSQKETVDLIRKAKKKGLSVTCETCPHYFTFDNEIEDKAVNPPLGNSQDIKAIKKGLADGTIDCIVSDFAPVPRPKNTGFASFDAFIWLSYGLVLERTLTPQQLKEKLYLNPMKIIKQNLNPEILDSRPDGVRIWNDNNNL